MSTILENRFYVNSVGSEVTTSSTVQASVVSKDALQSNYSWLTKVNPIIVTKSPNPITISALAEADDHEHLAEASSVDELFSDLDE
ncbi:MAG: hypothetical protein WD492_14155 [Alkalispirochaeta sp.]